MIVLITIFTCIGIACTVGLVVAAIMIGGKSEEVMKDIMDGESKQ